MVVSKSIQSDWVNARYVAAMNEIERESQQQRADYAEELRRQTWRRVIAELMSLSEMVDAVQEMVTRRLICAPCSRLRASHLRGFEQGKGVLMPLRPHICVTGIEGAQCSVLRGAMAPLLIALPSKRISRTRRQRAQM